MKKSIQSIILLLSITNFAFAGGKNSLSLKEKIEKNKPVKVFFHVDNDIIDYEEDKKLKAANPEAQTSVRTAMPAEFYTDEIKNNLLDVLNAEMQLDNALVQGDISTLAESEDRKTNFKDLTKLADGIYAMVYAKGTYTRFLSRKEVEGKSVFESSNNLEIKSNLFFYEVKSGEVKKYKVNTGLGAFLGRASSESIKTDKLENLEFMETNFPALGLLDEYKRTMNVNATDFSKRMLKKHEKTVSKRK